MLLDCFQIGGHNFLFGNILISVTDSATFVFHSASTEDSSERGGTPRSVTSLGQLPRTEISASFVCCLWCCAVGGPVFGYVSLCLGLVSPEQSTSWLPVLHWRP